LAKETSRRRGHIKGQPMRCLRGHSTRWRRRPALTPDQQATKNTRRRAYEKQWKTANHERLRTQRYQWYEANRESILAKKTQRRAQNPEPARAAIKRWYKANRDRSKAYQQTWREANRERVKANVKAWKEANPEKTAEKDRHHAQRRRAAKRNVAMEAFTNHQIWEQSKGICGICGVAASPTNWERDHIIPLDPGPETLANMQVSHPRCNNRKKRRLHLYTFLPWVMPEAPQESRAVFGAIIARQFPKI